MNVKIGNIWIKSDSTCSWVEKEKVTTKKDGTQTVSIVNASGYHTSFSHLLESYARKEIMQSKAENVEELLEDIDRIKKEVEKLHQICKGEK